MTTEQGTAWEAIVEQRRRSSIAFGAILVLLGIWLLIVQLVPGLPALFGLRATWPLIVIGIGVVLLLFAILAGAPGMAVPASIVGGIGALLYWQSATNNWESWAWAWTLIPGFVGIGVILTGLLGENRRSALVGGLWLLVISFVLFQVFATLLGGPNLLGNYWPVLVIVLGVVLLIRSLVRTAR